MITADATTTEPMRRSLCLLTNAYPDFPESNRVVFIRTLAGMLSRNGWDVSVVAPRIFPESKPREREDKIEIIRFPSFMGNKLLVEYARPPVFRLAGYMAAGVFAAVKCVRKRKCELIHAHWVVPAGLIALVAGWICRVPVVVTAHGSDILVVPGKSVLVRRLVSFVLRHANAVTSVAEHLTGTMEGMGLPREEVLTFPMSVPTESFCAEGPITEAEGHIVLSNRSLYPVYDVETLVCAASIIATKDADARILIAGDGPERMRLTAQAAESGVAERVKFLGSIAHDHMPEYLRGATVYVSTALSDGASVSLLEAMACGTFPVVADIAANREWIQDGINGFLFAPGDATVLAAKILDGFNNPSLRERAREVNTQIVRQKAEWNRNIERLLGLYERVTNRP